MQVLVDLKSAGKLVLESKIESFEVTSASASGDTATVETRERWRYHDRHTRPGEPDGPEFVADMKMRYGLVREGGRWKVESVATLSNEFLEPKVARPGGRRQSRASTPSSRAFAAGSIWTMRIPTSNRAGSPRGRGSHHSTSTSAVISPTVRQEHVHLQQAPGLQPLVGVGPDPALRRCLATEAMGEPGGGPVVDGGLDPAVGGTRDRHPANPVLWFRPFG